MSLARCGYRNWHVPTKKWILSQDGNYDLVKNKCAHYVVKLAQQVDQDITPQIDYPRATSFVARRLVKETSAQFVDSLRDDMVFVKVRSWWESLYRDYIQYYVGFLWGADSDVSDGSNHKEATDEALLEEFTKQTASKLLL